MSNGGNMGGFKKRKYQEYYSRYFKIIVDWGISLILNAL
jgi:hypothetical protein